MIIQVDEHGVLKVNSEEKSVESFSQDFLENLVNESLADNVDFKIEGVTPIAEFFRAIQEGTKPESNLRKLQEEIAAKEAMQNAPIRDDEKPLDEGEINENDDSEAN